MDLRMGDLLFYYDDPRIGAKFVVWLQKIFKETANAIEDYSHVAMVSDIPNVVIEMKVPEPRFSVIDTTKKYHVYRPKCDDETKANALKWCCLHMGANYRFIHYIYGYFGWRRATKICSGWLNEGFTSSLYPLVEQDDLVSPGEL